MNLIDNILESDFSRNGFLVIQSFLNNTQLQKLQDLYQNSQLNNTKGKMYSNIEDRSLDESLYIEQQVLAICQTSIEQYFTKYKVAGASFLIKGTGKNSDSQLHQDWNIVDEAKDKSLVIWIPLVDVDEQNGCLQVVPGSHKWFRSIRSSNIDSIHLKFDYKLNPFIRAVPLKMKDAAVYIISTFHGSKPNITSIDRPAIAISLIDDKAGFIHYVKGKDGNVNIVQCSNEFMYSKYFRLHYDNEEVSLSVLGKVDNPDKYIVSKKMFFKKLYKEKLKSIFTKSV